MFQPPLPGMAPQTSWTPTPVKLLPSWANAKRVGIDIETNDPTLGKKVSRPGSGGRGSKMGPGVRHGGYVAGVSFSIEDGEDFYLPIAHGMGGNLDPDHVFDYLADQAKAFTGEVVGLNLAYDLDYLAEQSVNFLSGRQDVVDVGVSECLLWELYSAYGLDAILKRRGLPQKDETHLREVAATWGINPKKEMWKLPAADVAGYAMRDSRGPLEIYEQHRREIEETKQGGAWAIEKALTPILIRMTRRGVKVNQSRLSRINSWAASEERAQLDKIFSLTGVRIKPGDTNKADALAPALEAAGVKVGRTSQGKPEIRSPELQRLGNPVADAIVRAKLMDKCQGFAHQIQSFMVRGRIHCRYNQTAREDEAGGIKGTRSNRLSATGPNLQQQFSRDPELGPLWRAIFVPEHGELWISADYSQQEPRLAVHYAYESKLPGSRAAVEYYRDNPAADLHQMTADLTELPRKKSKAVFLAQAYGQGGAAFAESLGLPSIILEIERNGEVRRVPAAGEEAQAILDKMDENVPWLKKLGRKVIETAKKRGFIKLLFGKRVNFPRDQFGNIEWTHKAFNRLVQGGSALQMKKATVDADSAGLALTLSVHDENCMSGSKKDARQLSEIMSNAVALHVPNRVDLETGESWGASMVAGAAPDDTMTTEKIKAFYD